MANSIFDLVLMIQYAVYTNGMQLQLTNPYVELCRVTIPCTR